MYSLLTLDIYSRKYLFLFKEQESRKEAYSNIGIAFKQCFLFYLILSVLLDKKTSFTNSYCFSMLQTFFSSCFCFLHLREPLKHDPGPLAQNGNSYHFKPNVKSPRNDLNLRNSFHCHERLHKMCLNQSNYMWGGCY